jgi:hypothetical protein
VKIIKFKIGDMVKCVENPKARFKGCGWKLDFIFKIKKIDSLGIVWDGYGGGGVFTQFLKLVKSLDLKNMEFKVGQKVKIKKDCTCCKKGEICTLHLGTKEGSDKSTLFAWGKGLRANCSCKNNWELFREKGMKVMFIVIYDRVDRDPTEKFYSRKELDEWLELARNDKDVVYDSIEIYEVGKQYNVKVTYKLKETK